MAVFERGAPKYLRRILPRCAETFIFLLALSGCSSLVHLEQATSQFSSDEQASKQISYRGPNPEGIVNGKDIETSDPRSKLAILLLITRGSDLSVCTGVVIAPRVILTAAHCLTQTEPKHVKVILNNRSGRAPISESRQADRIVIHEKYNGDPKSVSDLALLHLAKSLPEAYKPVSLMQIGEKITGDSALLIGFGITGETKHDSMTLRETSKSFKTELHLKETSIGIDQRTKTGGFCRGDSGAPVFADVEKQRKLIGINSFTVGLEKDRECHTASVAMLIPHFAGWIKNHADLL